MLSYDEARDRLLAACTPVCEVEEVSARDARGRVLAVDLVSPVDVPPLDNSAMDGYAVRVADIAAAGTVLAVAQRIAAGGVGTSLAAGSAARIFTGAPVPPGADAIVMQEQCAVVDGGVRIDARPAPGEHIRRRGEDIARRQVVLPAGTWLGPAQLGVAASVGADRLRVWRRVRVAVLATGDELARPGTPVDALAPGTIYNSNLATLCALVEATGCEVGLARQVADDLETTRAALRDAAATHDLVLTSGGVSVGEADHVKPAVAAEGALDVWKIAIKPGKPLAFGHVRRVADNRRATSTVVSNSDRAHFIGLPGNPVSAFVTFAILVRPFLRALRGGTATDGEPIDMRADFDWPPGGKVEPRREFLRVRRNAAGGLDLFANQSSGVLTSCAWADGLVDNPAQCVIRKGDRVRYLPLAEWT